LLIVVGSVVVVVAVVVVVVVLVFEMFYYDGRKYPWGNDRNASGALPMQHSGRWLFLVVVG